VIPKLYTCGFCYVCWAENNPVAETYFSSVIIRRTPIARSAFLHGVSTKCGNPKIRTQYKLLITTLDPRPVLISSLIRTWVHDVFRRYVGILSVLFVLVQKYIYSLSSKPFDRFSWNFGKLLSTHSREGFWHSTFWKFHPLGWLQTRILYLKYRNCVHNKGEEVKMKNGIFGR